MTLYIIVVHPAQSLLASWRGLSARRMWEDIEGVQPGGNQML